MISRLRDRLGEPQSERLTVSFLAVMAVVFIGGPYIFGPVRLEHVAIYGLATLAIAVGIKNSRSGAINSFNMTWPSIFLVVFWLGLFAWSLVRETWLLIAEDARWEMALSGADSFALPASSFFLGTVLASRLGFERAITLLTFSAAGLMAVNAAVAGFSSLLGPPAFLGIFQQSLWATELSTSEKSLDQYLGVFNLPAEAGLAYSLVSILLVQNLASRPMPSLALLFLLSVGGILSVSKVYSLGGVFLIILIALILGGLKAVVQVGATIVGGTLVAWSLVPKTVFERIFLSASGASGETVVNVALGGRAAAQPGGVVSTGEALSESTFWGLGLSAIQTQDIALDSAFQHVWMMAGLPGSLLYAGIIASLFVGAITTKQPFRVVAIAVFVLLMGSTLGFEPISSNRSGTLVCLTLGAFFGYGSQTRRLKFSR